MPSVTVLIADPARAPLDPGLVREVARAVKGTPRQLAVDEAAEIASDALDPDAAAETVAPLVAGLLVDHACLPMTTRRKRLLVSDMDSTMITIECIDELADFAGIKPQIAEVTRRAMNGEIDFPTALRARVALLEGLPVDTIAEVIRGRLHLMPGARTLVRTMRAHGACTMLVSGGFTAFTSHVRDAIGFDADEANVLEIANGRLTGRLVGPLRDAGSKLAALERLMAERGLEREATAAVGDGANDLPMIRASGLGIAFRAHPRVRTQAPVRVEHGDLTAVLYLQGYTKDEFAGG